VFVPDVRKTCIFVLARIRVKCIGGSMAVDRSGAQSRLSCDVQLDLTARGSVRSESPAHPTAQRLRAVKPEDVATPRKSEPSKGE